MWTRAPARRSAFSSPRGWPDALFVPSKFTITAVGAEYPDGTTSGYPVAPVVGSTGKLRFKGYASLGADEQDNLIVTLIRTAH